MLAIHSVVWVVEVHPLCTAVASAAGALESVEVFAEVFLPLCIGVGSGAVVVTVEMFKFHALLLLQVL